MNFLLKLVTIRILTISHNYCSACALQLEEKNLLNDV